MGPAGWVAVVVVAAAVVQVARGWEVRLVLLAAALLIAGATGALAGSAAPVAAVVRSFLGTFADGKFVVPICSAMGFAYVLRHTGCDRHLVLLLTRPLESVRGLMVPGVVGVGFLVNVPVISQTSTAVCLGPVVVPLMRAAGYAPATIGACLLLGASVGGELLNPGAPELATISDRTKVPTPDLARRYLPPLVLVQLAVSAAVLWVMSRWWEKNAETPPPNPLPAAGRGDRTEPPPSGPPSPPRGGGGGEGSEARIDLFKAGVPLVPLLLLFAAGPPLSLFDVPDEWVHLAKDGERDTSVYSSRLIGLAMLVGVGVAMLAAPGKARECVKEFFAGAGSGFATIVSLIVTAGCLAAAVKEAGLADSLARLIAVAPGLLVPLAALLPLLFAAVSGSGMASTQGLYESFHGPAEAQGLDPSAVGAVVGVGSAAGRTMSPVSAVTLMCGTLTGVSPFVLAKRVAVPLLAGVAAAVGLRMAGVL